MQTNPVAMEARSRSNLYGLLSRITGGNVDAALLDELRQPTWAEALKEAGADLSGALAAGDDAKLLQDLAADYTQLFVLRADPYESIQRGETQVNGQRTQAARRFMQEIGLTLAEGSALLPDHIAVELDVMRHLSLLEILALEGNFVAGAEAQRVLQRRYFREHLGAWGVGFFTRVGANAQHDFYRQMAKLAVEFLGDETVTFVG